MDNVGILTALVGGLISFVSPCVLPLVRPYLCYIGGVSIRGARAAGEPRQAAARRRARGARLRARICHRFRHLRRDGERLRPGGTAADCAAGHGLRDSHPDHLDWRRPRYCRDGAAFPGGVPSGIHFAGGADQCEREAAGVAWRLCPRPRLRFGWTPCIGPILAAILGLAGSEDTVASGAFLLFVYALDIGVPFLLAAGFAPAFLGWSKRLRPHLGTVEKTMGAFLVVTGVLFVTGQMTRISYWMIEAFPGLATLG